MKILVAIGVGLIAVLTAIYSGLIDQLMVFVIVGQIPFTNRSLDPVVMIIFWLLLTPTIMLARRLATNELWQIIERIGNIHQRGINLQHRISHHAEKYTYLAIITLLHAASQIPESTTNDPELYLRRRFVVLPA